MLQLKDLLNKEYNCFPLIQELQIDTLNPISAYLKLKQKNSFLFESIVNQKQGRYSFIGLQPRKVLKITGDPIPLIQSELHDIRQVPVDGPDFMGGAVGFISYDCVEYFEPSTKREVKDSLGIPDSVMMFCDDIVAFDHLYNQILIIVNVFTNGLTQKEIEKKYHDALKEMKRLEMILVSPVLSDVDQFPITKTYPSTTTVDKQTYSDFVGKIKEHIQKGDVIQTVPSRRLVKKTNLHPFNAYRVLRRLNPSPYMFYMDLDDFQIVGASPEMLVKVSTTGRVEMRPIAGTRKRGKTIEKDNEMARELIMDLKERSEHVMLVDLGRNDVNRVCEPSSVTVDSLMHIEKYKHVMHIVSSVSGQLRSDKTGYDAFKSIFPAGTVSGAPKIRAMQIIYELEGEKRGVYAGSVGYFGYNKSIDTCISIRTMLFKDGNVYLQAGGGIVVDSNEDDEFLETENKLKSNVVAVEEAERIYALGSGIHRVVE